MAFLAFNRRRPGGRFVGDKKGVAAIEMALISPILVTSLLGLIEVTDVLMAQRKVTTMTNSVADLVARVSQIDDQGLEDVYAASGAIMQPFSADGTTITITSIVRDNNNNITVHWSHKNNGTSPHAQGSDFSGTLPSGVLPVNESVILAEIEYAYEGPPTRFLVGSINMTDQYIMRPRRSRTVLRCDDLGDDNPNCF